MKKIAFFNLKGGCGKTTSVINLGSLLARDGNRVLLIDTDMQSNLTTSLMDYDVTNKNIYDIMLKKVSPKEALVEIDDNLDLIPSSLRMALVEPKLEGMQRNERILDEALKELEDDYDFCLIDCSPSYSTVTTNALLASDEIFIPLETEYFAIDGIKLLEDMLAFLNSKYQQNKKIDVIFAARHDKRNNINRLQYQNLKQSYPDIFSPQFIRKNVALVESPVFKECIFDYKPRSIGARDYRNLYKDLIKRGLF